MILIVEKEVITIWLRRGEAQVLLISHLLKKQSFQKLTTDLESLNRVAITLLRRLKKLKRLKK